MSDKKLIDKENWQEARGIRPDTTNSALATRNYSIECEGKYVITIIQGYWIWWCSTHHQPKTSCDKARLESIIEKLKK